MAFVGLSPFFSLKVLGQGVAITFRLHSPDLSNDSTVYITGGVAAIGHWNPAKVKMTSEGDHVWIYQIAGTVKYHRQMQGEGIPPRDVIIWLLPGYDNTDKRYPVLYMTTGRTLLIREAEVISSKGIKTIFE